MARRNFAPPSSESETRSSLLHRRSLDSVWWSVSPTSLLPAIASASTPPRWRASPSATIPFPRCCGALYPTIPGLGRLGPTRSPAPDGVIQALPGLPAYPHPVSRRRFLGRLAVRGLTRLCREH